MLINHNTTEDEKYEICEWKYSGDFAIYDMESYDKMKEKHFAFANPKMYVESFLDNNDLIDFCNLYDDGDEIFFGIGVNPNFCNRGHGTEMIETMYAISKRMFHGKPLYLEVRTWNKRAIRCYQKAGFVIDVDTICKKTHVGEGVFYLMVKK